MAPHTIPGVAANKKVLGIPTGEHLSSEDRVHAILGSLRKENDFVGWGASLIKGQLTLVSASAEPTGMTIFVFTVKEEHCNRLGNLHGGCAATIFDIATTTALAPIAKPGFWAYAGVTRTLNVTFIRPMAEGEEILVESTVVHAGKRLTTIHGVMKRKSDGAVMATCEHGKVSIDPEVAKI